MQGGPLGFLYRQWRGRSTFSRPFVTPSIYSKCPLQSSASALAAEGAQMHGFLGGEVDPSLNDSPWAQRKWIHGTEQFLRQKQPKFSLLPPTSSSSFPPTCIPQPPAQVQPLLSCGNGLPLAGDASRTWDLLASP